MRHRAWTASQAPLAAKRPDGIVDSARSPYLGGRVGRSRHLGVAAMIGLQFQRLPIAAGTVMKCVIAVSGEEGELGQHGWRLHPPDNEPRRRGVRLGLGNGV